jgi:hypothetical protein
MKKRLPSLMLFAALLLVSCASNKAANECSVKRLMLVGKPGAIGRLSAPAPKAIISFAKNRFDLTVEVFELREAVKSIDGELR